MNSNEASFKYPPRLEMDIALYLIPDYFSRPFLGLNRLVLLSLLFYSFILAALLLIVCCRLRLGIAPGYFITDPKD